MEASSSGAARPAIVWVEDEGKWVLIEARPIAPVDRIPGGIEVGIQSTLRADRIRAEKDSQESVVVAGVQIGETRLLVLALVDPSAAFNEGRRACDLLSVRPIRPSQSLAALGPGLRLD
jgi:hypothetical protein